MNAEVLYIDGNILSNESKGILKKKTKANRISMRYGKIMENIGATANELAPHFKWSSSEWHIYGLIGSCNGNKVPPLYSLAFDF